MNGASNLGERQARILERDAAIGEALRTDQREGGLTPQDRWLLGMSSEQQEAFNTRMGDANAYAREQQRLEPFAALENTRNNYIDLTANRRRVSLFSRKYSRKKLAAAKQEYDEARDAAGSTAAAELLQQYDEDTVRKLGHVASRIEARNLANSILKRRIDIAEDMKGKKFYTWWARQGGEENRKKGSIKKGLVMAGIGFVPGLAAGAVGATILGPIVGAALAAGAARGVARGLARAHIEKGAEGQGITVAYQQAGAHLYDKVGGKEPGYLEQATAAYDNGEVLTNAHITNAVESATKHEVGRNRRRLGASALIGAGFGLAGSVIADHFTGDPDLNTRFLRTNSADVDVPDPDVPDADIPDVDVPDADVPDADIPDVDVPDVDVLPEEEPDISVEEPEIIDPPVHEVEPEIIDPPIADIVPEPEEPEVFFVEHGHGYTHELQDYLTARGVALEGHEYYHLHTDLLELYGPDYLQGIPKYNMSPDQYVGDIGLARPGYAEWAPGVEEYLQRRFLGLEEELAA